MTAPSAAFASWEALFASASVSITSAHLEAVRAFYSALDGFEKPDEIIGLREADLDAGLWPASIKAKTLIRRARELANPMQESVAVSAPSMPGTGAAPPRLPGPGGTIARAFAKR